MTQKTIGELFGKDRSVITKQLKNNFESCEMVETAVISILETTAVDGKTYKTKYYNQYAIISVGYRVNSYKVTQFRI